MAKSVFEFNTKTKQKKTKKQKQKTIMTKPCTNQWKMLCIV